ncbi:MAG: DASS family sodium-coupled anion symporter [Acidobacteriota bacterium]
MAGLSKRKVIGLFLGPLLFVACLLAPLPEGMPVAGWRVAAVTALMAAWWITEAIPIAATALIPIALYPALGVMPSSEVTVSYANHLIYLYLGGFLIAVTIERWELHRRIALLTIRTIGFSPRRIILGFMLATAGLSMWISNTATAMMMLPIGLAVVQQASRMTGRAADPDVAPFRFGTGLMLGIAYSASIGGIATLIGTPPNAILAGVVERTFAQHISFLGWMKVGLPLALVMLVVTWLYLTNVACRSEISTLPGGVQLIESELESLGPVSREQKWVLAVFTTVAAAWILRGLVHWKSLAMIQDSTIAIAGALVLFVIPSDWRRGVFLLDWRTAIRVPWDIIILFGGGFALANGFSGSGLTEWIASNLHTLQGTSPAVLIGVTGLVVIFLTEITSNTATASLALPIVAAFAEAVHVHPYGLMVTVAIAASFAFMMPVATPPNAIVYSSRYVTMPQMAVAGFGLNLIGAVLLLLAVLLWLPLVWGTGI